jgi:hypothetical protein
VLYTACDSDGAIAEMHFHLKRGQPVFPSKVRYRLYELYVKLSGILDLGEPSILSGLGVDMSRFGQLSYNERVVEYTRTQEVAEVAQFLEVGGLMVPNARWQCLNIVIFCDRAPPGSCEGVKDHGLIDWGDWEAQHRT